MAVTKIVVAIDERMRIDSPTDAHHPRIRSALIMVSKKELWIAICQASGMIVAALHTGPGTIADTVTATILEAGRGSGTEATERDVDHERHDPFLNTRKMVMSSRLTSSNGPFQLLLHHKTSEVSVCLIGYVVHM
jgi:hypothetical protein